MADTLSIRDNRTGQQYEVPITDGTIRAADLKQVAVDDEPGLATYDPGFVNTASCRSSITYIDGDAGILEYRGYPIEQLAESSTFLEVSYLLLYGELPTQDQLDSWVHEVTYHTFLHENLKQFIQGFPIGKLHILGGLLPAAVRRASNAGSAGQLGPRGHLPHVPAREPQAVHPGFSDRKAPHSWRSLTCCCTASFQRRISWTAGSTRSPTTRSCTRTSSSSSRVSATTHIRWAC